MSELNDVSFYDRREQQERMLAARAESPVIRNIHLELAQSYVELASRAAAGNGSIRPRLKLRLVD